MGTVIIELEPAELLMMQEVMEESYKSNPHPMWKFELLNRVIHKAKEAYQKPHMTRQEYEFQVAQEREYWSDGDPGLQEEMARAKGNELHFLYEVEP